MKLLNPLFFFSRSQKEDFVVAIKVIAKKNLSKTQNLLAKEIKILKVRKLNPSFIYIGEKM